MQTELSPAALARIEKLRAHALSANPPSCRSEEGEFYYLKGWLDSRRESHILRRGLAAAVMLDNMTPVIDPYELIVGKPCYRPLTKEELEIRNAFRAVRGFDALPSTGGQASHMAIDYEKLLSLGTSGIIREIEEKRACLDLDDPENIEKDDFYRACAVSLSALERFAGRYSEFALKLSETESDPERAAELREISRVLSRVPKYPAESFHEALQSVHFVTFLLNGLYQLGRPDRYLLRFYLSDVAAGKLTPESALELICCRDILDNEYIPRGLAIGFMVGGRDAAGKDVTNPLTYLFIQSIGYTRMIYPGVGLCVDSDTPEELLDLAMEKLAAGCTHPALFNDETITRGLKSYGLSDSEACLYTHSTCVEITPCACSAVWVASPYINLSSLLLDLLAQINDKKRPAPADFEAFTAAYRELLAEKVRLEAIDQNRQQLGRMRLGGDPLVSSFVNDCLERGKDIDMGGARYNWIMPSFVGVANLCDSLWTIKKMIYNTGELTFEALSAALASDYKNDPVLLSRINNMLEKYGNDCDEVDSLVSRINGWILAETSKHRTARGDRFIPSLFCWVMHEHLGSQTGATPDGRRAGFPFGDGSGPAQSREKNGPTASILSSTKWDHSPFIGGIAVNMKFSKSVFSGESFEKMRHIIKTFMARGGFELQINVCDGETLRRAMEHPEEYADLVVRIGGYSDYFTKLNKNMQLEVLERTEHAI